MTWAFINSITLFSASSSTGFQFQTSTRFWGHTWCESYLDSNIPRVELANKTLKHVAHLVRVDDPEVKTMVDYRVVKYEVTIDGNDVVFKIEDKKDKVDIAFEKLRYKVYYFEEHNEFLVNVEYPPQSLSSINTVEVALEGLVTPEGGDPELVKSISSCSNGKCRNYNGHVLLYDISKSLLSFQENIFVLIPDDVVNKTQGLVTIAVESTNAIGSKFKVSFDVTSQLFSEIYSIKRFLFFPTILDLQVTKGNGGYTVACRALGTYNVIHHGIRLTHIFPDGRLVHLTDFYSTFDVYSTTKYYTLPTDTDIKGTYICSIMEHMANTYLDFDTKYFYVM